MGVMEMEARSMWRSGVALARGESSLKSWTCWPPREIENVKLLAVNGPEGARRSDRQNLAHRLSLELCDGTA